ncbi:MAG: hypothetical protein ACPG4U_09685 [Pseudomonadales bacterium]
MSLKITRIVSIVITLWIAKVFLSSIPYKFSNHPDTQHIFGTIGQWMSDTLFQGLGDFFASKGAVLVGSAEIVASAILVAALLFSILSALGKRTPNASLLFAVGGLFSSAIMAGAAFFHLFTPLGVEVLHEGKSDGGSLFYAAVSILVLGVVMALLNKKHI